MTHSTVRKYKLRTPEIYRRWTEAHPDKGRPVLRDIASAVGMSPNSLSAALRGMGHVLPGTADRIAHVLCCQIEDIAEATHYTPIMPVTEKRIIATTFAIDRELMAQLNSAAMSTGKNRSVIVREAVADYLPRLLNS
jgi:DNA-binding Xre family transcriptional regulator